MQQLVMLEEEHQRRDIIGVRIERRFGAHTRNERLGIARVPARQELEFEPTDAIEAVTCRVVDHPRRRAVAISRGIFEAQVLAQPRQRNRPLPRCSRQAQSPVHSRSAASGRRNTT